MKVTLTESGGYANIRKSCTVDTQQLPKAKAGQLERALRNGHIFGIAKEPMLARDARTIVIEVISGGTHKRAAFSEAAPPDGARVVIDILRPYCHIVPASKR